MIWIVIGYIVGVAILGNYVYQFWGAKPGGGDKNEELEGKENYYL